MQQRHHCKITSLIVWRYAYTVETTDVSLSNTDIVVMWFSGLNVFISEIDSALVSTTNVSNYVIQCWTAQSWNDFYIYSPQNDLFQGSKQEFMKHLFKNDFLTFVFLGVYFWTRLAFRSCDTPTDSHWAKIKSFTKVIGIHILLCQKKSITQELLIKYNNVPT